MKTSNLESSSFKILNADEALHDEGGHKLLVPFLLAHTAICVRFHHRGWLLRHIHKRSEHSKLLSDHVCSFFALSLVVSESLFPPLSLSLSLSLFRDWLMMHPLPSHPFMVSSLLHFLWSAHRDCYFSLGRSVGRSVGGSFLGWSVGRLFTALQPSSSSSS